MSDVRTLHIRESGVYESATGHGWSAFEMSLTARFNAPPLVRLAFDGVLDPVAYELVLTHMWAGSDTVTLKVRPDAIRMRCPARRTGGCSVDHEAAWWKLWDCFVDGNDEGFTLWAGRVHGVGPELGQAPEFEAFIVKLAAHWSVGGMKPLIWTVPLAALMVHRSRPCRPEVVNTWDSEPCPECRGRQLRGSGEAKN